MKVNHIDIAKHRDIIESGMGCTVTRICQGVKRIEEVSADLAGTDFEVVMNGSFEPVPCSFRMFGPSAWRNITLRMGKNGGQSEFERVLAGAGPAHYVQGGGDGGLDWLFWASMTALQRAIGVKLGRAYQNKSDGRWFYSIKARDLAVAFPDECAWLVGGAQTDMFGGAS